LRYWYAANIIAISNQRLDNRYPHAQETSSIPGFFRKCLADFKDYHRMYGLNSKEISAKQIYEKLVSQNGHVPSAIIRFSQMGDYLANLPKYKFLDP